MNNERYNQIINEVWKKYGKSHWTPPENPDSKLLKYQLWSVKPMQHNKESFIYKIKTNPEFSERWGLKIEERELSYDERFRIAYQNLDLRKKLETESKMLHFPHGHNKVMDDVNIPTKLLTVTYNNETIEVYE